MDNKDFEKNNENLTEDVTEAAEETVAETAEELTEAAEELTGAAEELVEEQAEAAAEEIGEETAEEEAVAEADGLSQGEQAEMFEQAAKEPMSKAKVAVITAVITAVVSVFCTLVAVGKVPQIYNKYNKGINVTGRTINDIAKEKGITPAEVLNRYGLPADMPKETTEASVYYRKTLGEIADMNGVSVDWLKEQLELGEEVTEDANWVEIEDGLTLGQYIVEADFDSFKEEYGLGKSVTPDTKFKKVRSKVYAKMKKSGKNSDKDFNIVVKYSVLYNKYNNMGYIDTNGMTLNDILEGSGMELSELLTQYGLPADMPGNTSVNAAQNFIPLGIFAGGEEGFAEIKEKLGLDDSVTEETTFGDAVKNVTVGKYIETFFGLSGEEGLTKFKEEYGFGDEVTLDTVWGDIRGVVDAKEKEKYEAQKAGSGK